jgi:hypothetical protein
MQLKWWFAAHHSTLAQRGRLLIWLLMTNDDDAFEKFTAGHLALKCAVLRTSAKGANYSGEIGLDELYSGALVTSDLTDAEMRFHAVNSLTHPKDVVCGTGEHFPETRNTKTLTLLKRGGVCLNSKGALVDVLMITKARMHTSEEFKKPVLAISCKHSQLGESELSEGGIITGNENAQVAAKHLNADQLITMHYSNRVLANHFSKLLLCRYYYGLLKNTQPKSK